MYKILDFSVRDWTQYFGGTYVKYTGRYGIRTGKIEQFLVNGKASILCPNGRRLIIPLERIVWNGLLKPRCIEWEGRLVYMGPSGARSHKKTPDASNMVAVVYRHSPMATLMGEGTGGGVLRKDMLLAYLTEDSEFPEDVHEVRALMDVSVKPVILSDTAGVFYDNEEGHWTGVVKGVPLYPNITDERISTLIQEVTDVT